MTDYTVPVTFRMVGLAELKEANNELKRMSGSSGPVAGATKSTQRFGRTAQNASYQVQDLIVQIQGGTDPMRALGQQLPQLTVGMGAWGAAIGLVAAALPALVIAMRDTDDAATDLDTSLGTLNDSLGNIGSTFQTLDLSNYVEQYLAADDATRQLMETTLEYEQMLARLDLNDVLGNLVDVPTQSPGTGGRTGSRAFDARFDDAAESLGLYAKQLREVQPLFEALRNEETRSAEVAAELNQRLREFVINGDIRNNTLRETIDSFRQVEQALRTLEGVEGEVTRQIREQGNEALRERLGLLEEIEVIAQKVTNDYDPNLGFDTGSFLQEEVRLQGQWVDGMWDIIEATEEAPEAFSLAAEGIEIFATSFDRALTGVAQGTQDLSDAFENMVKVILVELGKLAAYQFLANAFAGTGFGNAAASLLPSAKGNVFSGGDVVPFAKGGVVNRPTVFPMANGAGLMGEAGPEAILPLRRDGTGRLGVDSSGMNVIVNNNAPGVAVEPRQTEEGLTIDVVVAQVAASIDRGGNPIANSIERNYNLGRGRGVY